MGRRDRREFRIGRPVRGRSRAALAAALALLAGCASAGEGEAPGPAETSVKATGSVPGAADFGRALVEMDRRVDEYVFLGTQTGEDVRERRALVESALEATAAQYLPSLLEAAADATDPSRRRTAAKALAFTRDPRAVPPLAKCLGAQGDARLLAGATFALARIASPETPIPPLLETAKDPDADVRSNALLALWHVFDARSDANAPPLDPATRAAALAAIEPALFDLGDPIIRGNAAAALGALGDARGVDSLINLLRDQHPFVRTHVALALGKLGDRRAVAPLVDVIDETPIGTPRSAVFLGISVLMERAGHTAPTNLAPEERSWRGWVERTLGNESGAEPPR